MSLVTASTTNKKVNFFCSIFILVFFYHPEPECANLTAITPRKIACPDTCLGGQYLKVDKNININPTCESCPKNYFNYGNDGILIDGPMGDFTNRGNPGGMPYEMQLECTVHSNITGEATTVINGEKGPCEPWSLTRFGLKAYKTEQHGDDTYSDFKIIMPVYLKNAGAVKFTFRMDGSDNNLFKFVVDDAVFMKETN